MHSLNIIHRDIKPENLLISKNDQVKICDLGFARSMPSNGRMTDYVATRWYRPPQLLIGKEDYDTSIDIWSIGCVMAEMIDGEPLFGGENDLDQLYLIQKCLGPLIDSHKEFFLKNPKFVGMKFPQIHVIESIDRRYSGKIDKLGLDLLKKMLKMNPADRITAQQALQHPYISRISTPLEREIKKPSILMQQDKQGANKSHLHINNFLQQKLQKSTNRDQKIGINKVTGLSKPQKISNAEEQPTASWVFSGKGKSLGKKPAASIRDKQYLGEKYQKPKVFKDKKYRNQQQEYAEDWDEIEPQEQKKVGVEKSERTDRKLGDRSEQKSVQNKKKKKLFKKESVNIVFNQNTFNLNIVEDHNNVF